MGETDKQSTISVEDEMHTCNAATMINDQIQEFSAEAGFGPRRLWIAPVEDTNEENVQSVDNSKCKRRDKTNTSPVRYCQHWYF
jgi:hypothetical protein